LSTFRHRAVGAVLTKLGLGREARVYEMSSRGALCRHLRRTFAQVTTSELFDDVVPGGFRDGVQCQDAQRLTYGDAAFDLVTSTEVFEHVPDDRRVRCGCKGCGSSQRVRDRAGDNRLRG